MVVRVIEELLKAVNIAKNFRREFEAKSLGIELTDFIRKLQVKFNLNIRLVDYHFRKNKQMSHISGALLQKNDDLIILTEKFENNFRKRFIVAHEIGHFILNSQFDPLYFHYDDYNNIENFEIDDLKEKTANAFAAELLMPEEQTFQLYNLFNKNIDHLSRAFGVTNEAMKLRLKLIHLL